MSLKSSEIKCPTCGVLGCKDISEELELDPMLSEFPGTSSITHGHCRNGHGFLLRFERIAENRYGFCVEPVDR